MNKRQRKKRLKQALAILRESPFTRAMALAFVKSLPRVGNLNRAYSDEYRA